MNQKVEEGLPIVEQRFSNTSTRINSFQLVTKGIYIIIKKNQMAGNQNHTDKVSKYESEITLASEPYKHWRSSVEAKLRLRPLLVRDTF